MLCGTAQRHAAAAPACTTSPTSCTLHVAAPAARRSATCALCCHYVPLCHPGTTATLTALRLHTHSFGISDQYEAGQAFDKELQERKKLVTLQHGAWMEHGAGPYRYNMQHGTWRMFVAGTVRHWPDLVRSVLSERPCRPILSDSNQENAARREQEAEAKAEEVSQLPRRTDHCAPLHDALARACHATKLN